MVSRGNTYYFLLFKEWFMMERLKRFPIWGYIIIIICFIAIIIGSYFLLLELKNTDGILLKEDLTCNFRENIKVSEFILDLDGELLDDFVIDTNEVGINNIEIKYRNEYGFVVKVEEEIEVIDITAPVVSVANPYTVEVGKDISFEEVIFCADDYDDDISCDVIGEYNLEQVGNYDLKIVATDKSGNETVKEFVLKVINKPSSSDKGTGNGNVNGGISSYTSFSEMYQKYKSDDTELGLDLSKWQGEVDFKKIKEQGVSFVMLKIGGQTKIDGEYIVDPRFYENIEKAIENDIDVGVYFYSYARSEVDARKQVKWIIKTLGDYDINMPIAFDWENWKKYTTFHIGFHTLNKVAKAFLDEVEKEGYEGLLYSSKYYLENVWYAEEYPVWLAYYTSNNLYGGDYQMWQLCSDGKIDGINGYVDIDVLYR